MFLDVTRRLFSATVNYIMLRTEIEKPNTFLYFAYGANILTFRMRMHSPRAEFVTIARLDNYRLDFIKYSSFWGGPTATLVPTANGHVWGVIWRIPKDDMESLDTHKGVDVKTYYVKHLRVLSQYMGFFTVRVYIKRVNPSPRGDNDPIPIEYWPSWTYKEIMVMGATEHTFPEYYIKQLKKIEDNGEEGALRTACLLIRYSKNEPCECSVPGRIPRKPLKIDLRLDTLEGTADTFLYYAYGSNMLKKRILLNNPSAQFLGIAKFEGHKLDFHLYSENWRGAAATIVPTAGAHIWGAVWLLHKFDLPALDKQEGVATNIYFAKTVDVTMPQDRKVQCRVYQQTKDPPPLPPGQDLSQEQRPSLTYMEVIITGAKECDLPSYYILELMRIPHNGQTASPQMLQKLNS